MRTCQAYHESNDALRQRAQKSSWKGRQLPPKKFNLAENFPLLGKCSSKNTKLGAISPHLRRI